MDNSIEGHFLKIVRQDFPVHAEFHVHTESDDICIYVDWKLRSDPNRPNKRSKKIKIRISKAAIEDYSDGSDQHRRSADENLRSVIANHLHAFDPEHTVPAHVPVPVEQWIITTEMINS